MRTWGIFLVRSGEQPTWHGHCAHRVLAAAGMVSDANKKDIEAAGLSFILGARMPQVPYVLEAWQRAHPGQDPEDGLLLTRP